MAVMMSNGLVQSKTFTLGIFFNYHCTSKVSKISLKLVVEVTYVLRFCNIVFINMMNF